jgi:hypothetical protein
MVMSKVSKTVIASFLCLLFNAGGNVTNAMNNAMESTNMETEDIFINNKNNENDFDINNNSTFTNNLTGKKDQFKFKINGIETEDGAKNEEKKDDDGKKTPDGEKSVWRWLFPVITGVGGTAIGILVGKFVL